MDINTNPLNFQKWILEHEAQLKPPVCNKLMFEENGFIIMVVGGPNQRKDYHVEEGPEFFYQYKGDMILKIIQDKQVIDIKIQEGEMYSLPPKVPHSPQRFKDTVGLVVERKRLNSEKDGLQWYCDKCTNLLYETYFQLKDVETDFPPIFNHFYSNRSLRTCRSCGTILEVDSIC